ncbi:hypothetical protein Tco_1221452 [Tanacetum coccineum]
MQYFQLRRLALWDVIENGNSFKPAAQTTTNVDGTSTSLIPGPVTTEEKTQKKNDVKARNIGVNTNGSQLVYEDLEQIHEDDIEEIDLKWQLALLSMRTRRLNANYHQRERVVSSNNYTREFDEGYVTFGGGAKGGKITGNNDLSKILVYNIRTRKVEESLHIRFLEDKPIITGDGPKWLFDIDVLTKSMIYVPVVAGYKTLMIWHGTEDSIGNASNDEPQPSSDAGKKDDEGVNKESGIEEKDENVNSINNINIVSSTVNTASIKDNVVNETIVYGRANDPNMPNLEEIIYSDDDEDVGAEADMTNMVAQIPVSHILITIIHKDHLVEQIIRDIHSAPQTRRMTKCVTDHVEPKKVIQALTDPSWIEVMQNELLQFKLQKMDVKSAYLYGKIEEEAYVCQPPRFENPEFPDIVYKIGQIDKTLFIERVKGDILQVQVYIDDIIFGSVGELTFFLGLQVTQKDDGIFISQDKYVDEILKKFGFSTMKIASTPMETSKPLMKDENDEDVDVYLYRSMIGSLMYLTSSRPDIMFVVCACARLQVTPNVSHLHAMKRIFRYLKGQPKLGLWYPKDSPFDLDAYTDSDYAGASFDRKSTIGGCQFLRSRLISWQCKKQTIVANSTTEAEYVAAVNCCGQTKHIEIRHHFIRDSYEKRLIQVIKIHTDHNVADLLTKALDVSQKLEDNADFAEIVDFLNASPIRQGKDFSGTVTPLFATMLIQSQAVEGEGSGQPTKSQHTPTTASPSHIEPILIFSGPTTLIADKTVYEERGGNVERDATTATSLDVE